MLALVRRLYLFFSGRNFFGGSKNIAGQTTVPFFPVIIFLGCNSWSYFDTSTNYGTYIRPEKITTRKKVQPSGWPCFFGGSNYNRKKIPPEKKKVQSSGRRLKSMFFGGVQITTGKNYDPKKKSTVVWPTVEINLRLPSVVSKYEHQS